jgi:hypothetical protein
MLLNDTLSEAIARYAEDTKAIGERLAEQVEIIGRRRQVLAEMQGLERYGETPTKVLEKRLSLLQQIQDLHTRLPGLASNHVSRLQERIDAIETIARLEPDPHNRPSLKILRERAKLLTTIADNDGSSSLPECLNRSLSVD